MDIEIFGIFSPKTPVSIKFNDLQFERLFILLFLEIINDLRHFF